MVERTAGDDCIERSRWDERFERHALEDRAFRRNGVDRRHLMAGRGERERGLPVAAADLEDPRRRPIEVREHEIDESHAGQANPLRLPVRARR